MKGYLDEDEPTAAANDAEYWTLRLKHWVKMDLSVFTPIIQEKKIKSKHSQSKLCNAMA